VSAWASPGATAPSTGPGSGANNNIQNIHRFTRDLRERPVGAAAPMCHPGEPGSKANCRRAYSVRRPE
jgi:hypothetical protein